MGTSNGSPLMTRSLVPPPEPNVALTLCPVACSKAGISCCTAALIPPGAIRATSAARASSQLHTPMMATADSSAYFFMVFLFELSGRSATARTEHQIRTTHCPVLSETWRSAIVILGPRGALV